MKNQKSVKQIKDFIDECLHGELDQLVTFDIKQLKGNRKYGACKGGGGFDSDNTEIVRAILAVVFDDVWPDMDEDSFIRKDYRGDTINTFNTLFGKPADGGFKGISQYNVDKITKQRVDNYYKLYTTIGNMSVLPNKFVGRYSLNTFRGTYYKWCDYFDKFLASLRTYLVEGITESDVFNQLMSANHEPFEQYSSMSGFTDLCNQLFLEPYLDGNNNVKDLFKVVCWYNKQINEDYLKAVNNYLDFCEPFIINRGKKMVSVLKEKIS